MLILPWLAIILVLAVLAALLVGLRAYQRRCAPHPELVRKLLHVGMGITCLGFPWLFSDPLPVLLLAALALAAMLALRLSRRLKRSYGCVLAAVERDSLGDISFPLGVALVFLLSGGDPLLYCLPVLLLTLADPAAALVGTRYGRLGYSVLESRRTVEGSLAFFGVAFVTIQSTLLLGGLDATQIIVTAALLSLLVMLVESVSWSGLDNLSVPVAGCILLMACLHIDVGIQAAILGIAGALAGMGLLALATERRSLPLESRLKNRLKTD